MGGLTAPTYEQLYRDANERIRQLEELNRTLAAEVDRMRPLCDIAVAHRHGKASDFALNNVTADYEASIPK